MSGSRAGFWSYSVFSSRTGFWNDAMPAGRIYNSTEVILKYRKGPSRMGISAAISNQWKTYDSLLNNRYSLMLG